LSTYALTMYRYNANIEGKVYKVGNKLKKLFKSYFLLFKKTFGIQQDRVALINYIHHIIMVQMLVYWYNNALLNVIIRVSTLLGK
jgi:hypothetical protein